VNRIFVFGTLKRGYANHHEGLGGRTFLGAYRTACPYPLIIEGRWFTPMMMPEPGIGHVVTGELYEVDDETLATLDRIETAHFGYSRQSIEIVSCADGSVATAWVYFKDREFISEVHSGYLSEYTDRRYVHTSQRPVD
jgi:gamma-glutamylaminecyclotransferase